MERINNTQKRHSASPVSQLGPRATSAPRTPASPTHGNLPASRRSSRTPRSTSRTQRAASRTARSISGTPRAAGQTPRANSRTPRASSRTPRSAATTSATPRANSRTPSASSTTPRATRTPRAVSQHTWETSGRETTGPARAVSRGPKNEWAVGACNERAGHPRPLAAWATGNDVVARSPTRVAASPSRSHRGSRPDWMYSPRYMSPQRRAMSPAQQAHTVARLSAPLRSAQCVTWSCVLCHACKPPSDCAWRNRRYDKHYPTSRHAREASPTLSPTLGDSPGARNTRTSPRSRSPASRRQGSPKHKPSQSSRPQDQMLWDSRLRKGVRVRVEDWESPYAGQFGVITTVRAVALDYAMLGGQG
jgi:hypothetical protein